MLHLKLLINTSRCTRVENRRHIILLHHILEIKLAVLKIMKISFWEGDYFK